MHLKANTENLRQDSKTMASYNSNSNNDDDNGSRTSNTTNSNNNNNGDDRSSANNVPLTDDVDIKLKKQTLEQRKHELEKLLSEKSWLLQQIQKQETQILNGNYEYLNLNEILANLAQQYKQEQAGGGSIGSSGSGPSILRRKTTMAPSSSSASKENQNINNNNSNRQSEVSNRSSEYDNYPGSGGGGGSAGGVEQSSTSVASQMGLGVPMATQPLPTKNALKKRTTPTPTPTANINYIQLQRQQHQQLLQQHVEQQILQQQVEQQMFQQHIQYAVHQQQQQQQKLLHYQQQQQRQFLQHQPADAISLYSVNSANVATLRHQHVAPQQQPIVVQCDKYYLSPTHQSYTDGGFIKSSQNIKKYISPMASPTQLPSSYEMQQQPQLLLPLQQLQQHQRQLDAISLAPSYLSVDAETAHNLRWRSQSNIPQHTSPSHSQDMKSHSSDMLAHLPYNYYTTPHPPVPNLKSKPLDEISISSLNSETQKQKSKPKQWLESSLDGPAVIRSPQAELPPVLDVGSTSAAVATFSRVQPPHKQQIHSSARERAKLSSQSMSSGRHYSMSSATAAQRHHHPHSSSSGGSSKLLQDDDGRYVKLSQSTSYLNSMEPIAISPVYHLDNASIDMPAFRLLPPKPNVAYSQRLQATPPPRPPPVAEKQPPPPPVVAAATSSSSLSPDIRIESPKNMTIVQQATFQPYKEVTKPFEMSDFYKYSTKFRQKESSAGNDGGADPSAN